MDLAAVTAFVQTAELRSFTAAARRLHLTASGVSKAVARLEADLGVRLLHRTTRSLSLTAEGQAFLDRCRHVLAELDDARVALGQAQLEPQGLLRVSMPVAYGRLVVLPRLVELMQKHPKLRVEASVTDRRVDIVEEGFDLAIRIGTLPDSRLIARRIDTAQFVVCASPDYLRREGRPARVADLTDHACVLSRTATNSRTLPWRLSEAVDALAGYAPRLTVDNGEALIDAAIAGAGLIYIHRYMVEAPVGQGRLEVVLEAEESLSLGVYAIYAQTRQQSSRIRAAVDQLSSAGG